MNKRREDNFIIGIQNQTIDKADKYDEMQTAMKVKHNGKLGLVISCPKCGKEMSMGINFCPTCGQRLDWNCK